ncbi:MAG: type II toxin-antitoxin system HicA family toxin [Oscillospiraceae bacterium]|jgi:predicted RNA binding protein YcfA (HicA-like mRNA interferase family)|nr:type II toxin-antitoxin system HicA family toxin [Oscillospiraceae bacterium]
MKRRDLVKQLKVAGYKEVRNDGGHAIFEKLNCRPVQVPNHRELNKYTAIAILKIAGIE